MKSRDVAGIYFKTWVNTYIHNITPVFPTGVGRVGTRKVTFTLHVLRPFLAIIG